MKLNKLIAIATISLLSGGISMAQKALNLEDIVAGNIIQTKGIGSMTWLKDGERYSRLENNKQTGGTDIVAYRAKDNSREVIIPSSLLTDKSTGRPIPVRSVSWSADNEKVLIYNNTRRVWRYDTRGDYWVLNLKDGALRQLGKGMPESSMMFAKFSPDGTRVAYVSNNNIYVEDIGIIPGLSGVLLNIHLDETVEAIIPASLGYGYGDYSGIPGGSTLIFTFTLDKVE